MHIELDRLREVLYKHEVSLTSLSELLYEWKTHILQANEKLYQQLNDIQSLLHGDSETGDLFGKNVQQIHDDLLKQNQLLAGIETHINSIHESLYSKEFPINVQFEREYYRDFPTEPSERNPSFRQDFLALIHGLDEESKETVALALQRLKIIQNSQHTSLSLYSEREKNIFCDILERFMSNVLPLGEDCFSLREYLLPINHFESCVFWDKCGVPHLEHPERFLDQDIIDAGAFIGDSALIFSPLTRRNVYAFEPVPQNYNNMKKTIELNSLKNVIPVPYALGIRNDKIKIAIETSVGSSCSSQFQNEAFQYEDKIDVDVISVDEFVHERGLSVGLIKADIEGAEQLLLSGAIETIKAQKPALLISIYHNADDFFHIKPMLEHLNLGYRFKVRHPVCGSVLTETMLIAEVE